MNGFFIGAGVILCLLMILALYRTVVGPTIIDRMMGATVIGTKTTILLVIIGTIYGRVEMFVDIALAYAMLNFIVTIAASRYFTHHKNITGAGFGVFGRVPKRRAKR
ncbi:MAG: monovalent cation/H+ antiporter complex subunit F [Desulfurivibrionaceae bacterium]|nr:monovalent cation/H+ antiporter complex subunit F [Desulfobulbales bacterium]MDT8334947.1 monovalent cation/H+ antiporter complex subunit F [Desulfurivibrionaceae bacterium]